MDSVHSRAHCGDQPLHIAAIWGGIELIEVFLDAGADINSEGEDAFTPLHYAIEQSKTEAAKLLISMGADLNKRDAMFGRTAFDLIAESGDPNIRTILK